jgi:hypothetical protein
LGTGTATARTETAVAAAAAGGPAAVCCLRELELTSGSLPDALMEAVGGCRGLQALKLNATASIQMGPVAHLTQLTRVTLTVSEAWGLWGCWREGHAVRAHEDRSGGVSTQLTNR